MVLSPFLTLIKNYVTMCMSKDRNKEQNMICDYCKKQATDPVTVMIWEGHKQVQRTFCCQACAIRYQMSCEG